MTWRVDKRPQTISLYRHKQVQSRDNWTIRNTKLTFLSRGFFLSRKRGKIDEQGERNAKRDRKKGKANDRARIGWNWRNPRRDTARGTLYDLFARPMHHETIFKGNLLITHGTFSRLTIVLPRRDTRNPRIHRCLSFEDSSLVKQEASTSTSSFPSLF